VRTERAISQGIILTKIHEERAETSAEQSKCSSSRQREVDRRKTACEKGEEPRGRRGGTAAAWTLARQQGQSPRAHAVPLVLGSSSRLSVAETDANE
jgi:hypothetical protein